MILQAYSVLDAKTGVFSPPFFTHHPANAIRMITDVASDLSTLIGRHPADYVLYQIGTWDDSTAHYEGQSPASLGSVVGFLPATKPLFEGA